MTFFSRMTKFLIAGFLLVSFFAFAEEEAKPQKEKPPPIGNFALPPSQQPAALVGFGANMLDAGVAQLFIAPDEFIGKHRVISDIVPSALFGITDDLSIYFNFPFTTFYRDGCDISHGAEDFFVQMEYVFYNKSTRCYLDQATILAAVYFPTGSIHKSPSTGFGSPALFLGATYYHTLVDWFFFVAPGATLTTSDHRTKYGNQFFYQGGFGRCLPSPKGWIYAWMIEIDGQYNQKNRIRGVKDPNSGGNSIFITPSVWVSSRKLVVQFGVGFPVNQNFFGDQHKFNHTLYLNVGWTFY